VFQIDDDILTEFGVVDYMKAIVLNKTGGLDVLKVSEVQKNNLYMSNSMVVKWGKIK